MWVCVCGGMSDAMGSRNACKAFSTGGKSSFSTGPASRNSQSKKVESKKPFFDSVRKPDLGFSPKRPFSTEKPDCIRNGLTMPEITRGSYGARPANNKTTTKHFLFLVAWRSRGSTCSSSSQVSLSSGTNDKSLTIK